jgi:hypothetical protein
MAKEFREDVNWEFGIVAGQEERTLITFQDGTDTAERNLSWCDGTRAFCDV